MRRGSIRDSNEISEKDSIGAARRRSMEMPRPQFDATLGWARLVPSPQAELPPSSQELRFRSKRSRCMQVWTDMAAPNLDKIPLFRQCSKTFCSTLATKLYLQSFEPGVDIIRQGDIGTTMYLLHCGEVEVIVGPQKIVVATLGCGSLFGEMAVICKNEFAAKRNATIRAKVVCNCWVADRPALLKILACFPQDEKVIAAEADRRLKELHAKGLIPSIAHERAWAKPLDNAKPKDAKQDTAKRLLAKVTALRRVKGLVSDSGANEGCTAVPAEFPRSSGDSDASQGSSLDSASAAKGDGISREVSSQVSTVAGTPSSLSTLPAVSARSGRPQFLIAPAKVPSEVPLPACGPLELQVSNPPERRKSQVDVLLSILQAPFKALSPNRRSTSRSRGGWDMLETPDVTNTRKRAEAFLIDRNLLPPAAGRNQNVYCEEPHR